jgi:hypothetical protein
MGGTLTGQNPFKPVSVEYPKPPDFDPDSMRWEMIGPVFENHFGIIFRFPVNLIADLEYDSERWI